MAERGEMLSRTEVEQAVNLLERRIKKADRRRPSDLETRSPFIRNLIIQIKMDYQARLEALKWVLGETNRMSDLYTSLMQESLGGTLPQGKEPKPANDLLGR